MSTDQERDVLVRNTGWGAMGVGHFFGLMPESMYGGTKRTGVELDSVSARIAAKLYPDSSEIWSARPNSPFNLRALGKQIRKTAKGARSQSEVALFVA